jgi:small conductance mechanosensitive channel
MEINLRSTVVHTPSGQVVTIPNRSVIQNPIINYSYLGKRRIELDCGISYTENLDHVEEVVRKALIGMELLESEKIEFYYTEFGESSINFKVRFWINQVNQAAYFHSRSEALRKIKRAFDNHQITIPFPIRTIDFARKNPTASEISE